VPVAAARLADVVAGDAQPLVIGGRGQHAPQQLAVLRLQRRLPLQSLASVGDTCRQRVAHPLQLLEAGDARLAEGGRRGGVDADSWKGLREQMGQLYLEAADLTAQLGAGEALVAPRPQRVSFEQNRHQDPPRV